MIYDCIICLPVYNCEKYLDNIFTNILKIRTLFNKFVVIFGYDHCKDNSLKMLRLFKKQNEDIDINIIINNNKRHKYRTHNLAIIRNLMIDFIFNNYHEYDFFIMMDSDDVCSSPINLDILKKHVQNNNLWDSVSFNKNNYYDIWALQYEPFVHHCRSYAYNSWAVINFIKNDITNKLTNLKEDEYFQVYSAFNGFGIYRTIKFINCKYNGIKQKYFDDIKILKMMEYLNESNIPNKRKKIKLFKIKENCEHIGFHINSILINSAKIMITKDILFG